MVPIAHGYQPRIRYAKPFQSCDLSSFPRLPPVAPERDAPMLLDESENSWLTGIAVVVVLSEVAAVLVLRAPYTMDVFTGAVPLFMSQAFGFDGFSSWEKQTPNPVK